jgi:transcriptional antiterminator NusG
MAEEKKTTKKENPNAKWYVLNIRTGYENSIQKELKQRVNATGTENEILEVLVPVQKKIVVKKGKQDVKEDRLFPGYVLIKMELNDRTWDIVRNTEGVRGFVKTDKYPRPLPESEVRAITKFMEVEQPSYQTSFSVGEAVKITDGAFADFIGSVQEIDTAKGKIKVLISFLGREAPVELEFAQVSKL